MFVTVLKLNTGYASGVKSVTGPGSYGILWPAVRCVQWLSVGVGLQYGNICLSVVTGASSPSWAVSPVNDANRAQCCSCDQKAVRLEVRASDRAVSGGKVHLHASPRNIVANSQTTQLLLESGNSLSLEVQSYLDIRIIFCSRELITFQFRVVSSQ